MTALAVLFILSFIATTTGEHTEFLISQLSTHLVGPSFFQNVTTDAKISYYKVLNNKTLTRNQQREQLIKWGSENEVEAPVRGYVEKQSRSLHEFRENINLFLMQLLDYEKEIDSIYFDDNITVEQREHLLFTLDCPAAMKKILSYAATAVKRYGLPKPKRTSRAPTTTAYKGAPTVATTKTATTTTAAGNNTVTSTTVAPATASGNVTITTTTSSATVIPTTGSNNTAPTTVTTTTMAAGAAAAGNVTTTVTRAATVATTTTVGATRNTTTTTVRAAAGNATISTVTTTTTAAATGVTARHAK